MMAKNNWTTTTFTVSATWKKWWRNPLDVGASISLNDFVPKPIIFLNWTSPYPKISSSKLVETKFIKVKKTLPIHQSSIRIYILTLMYWILPLSSHLDTDPEIVLGWGLLGPSWSHFWFDCWLITKSCLVQVWRELWLLIQLARKVYQRMECMSNLKRENSRCWRNDRKIKINFIQKMYSFVFLYFHSFFTFFYHKCFLWTCHAYRCAHSQIVQNSQQLILS